MPAQTVSEDRSGVQRVARSAARGMKWKRSNYQKIAAEISSITRYYDRLIQVDPQPSDAGELFDLIDCPTKERLDPGTMLPDLVNDRDQRTALLLNGNLNHSLNIQATLEELRPQLARTSRLLVVAYSPYFRWFYSALEKFRFRKQARVEEPFTFLTRTDLDAIGKLAQFEVTRSRPALLFPFHWFGLGAWIHSFLAAVPGVRRLAIAQLLVLRPVFSELSQPSLSVIVPARNEKGNIENALKRMPDFGGASLEVLFVEGHSTDETWQEIQRVARDWGDRLKIRTFQQKGKGKVDAVRLGIEQATGDLVTVLDADLTMPPELLVKFYDAYNEGLGDFINGNRLVYPMEGQAMRFLNVLGNVFFSKALSAVLDQRLGDTLCGTKLFAMHDARRFIRWRADFGDFDPFGDYEMLFPASMMGLGIVDVPIRYRDRTYGSTNISRFRHGAMLLKMTLIGLFKVRSGRLRSPAA